MTKKPLDLGVGASLKQLRPINIEPQLFKVVQHTQAVEIGNFKLSFWHYERCTSIFGGYFPVSYKIVDRNGEPRTSEILISSPLPLLLMKIKPLDNNWQPAFAQEKYSNFVSFVAHTFHRESNTVHVNETWNKTNNLSHRSWFRSLTFTLFQAKKNKGNKFTEKSNTLISFELTLVNPNSRETSVKQNRTAFLFFLSFSLFII